MSRLSLNVPNTFAAEGTGPVAVSQIDTNFTTATGWVSDSSNGFGYWLQDTGAINNYVVTYPASIVPSGLTPGFWLVMRAAHTNTAACTITVGSLSAQSITDSTGAALTASSIVAGNNYAMMYTGTTFSLMFPTSTSGLSLVGEVKMFASTAVPTNYLVCNGALVSRVTYANLFAVIGTAYGSGSGTFAVPNFNGFFPTHATPGVFGGANAVGLGVANLPPHNHPATSTDSGHFHGNIPNLQAAVSGGSGVFAWGGIGVTNTGIASASITTTIGNTGSGTPFSIIPPFCGIYFIIRAF